MATALVGCATCLVGHVSLLAGCASSGNQTPELVATRNTGVTPGAPDGAVYNIPVPAEPRGQVRIVPVGRENFHLPQNPKLTVPALHLTMEVLNQKGTDPWTVDARLQTVLLSGTRLRPSSVKAPGGELPLVRIKPGEKKTIDLYYALPKGLREPQESQSFDFSWAVSTGKTVAANITPIKTVYPGLNPRLPASNERGAPTKDVEVGVKGEWWMDPFTDLPPPWQDLVQ
jgi:hypothetical protein